MGALRTFSSLTSGAPDPEESDVATALAAVVVESELLVGILSMVFVSNSALLRSIDSSVAAADVPGGAEVAACAAVAACCEGLLCTGAGEAPAPLDAINAPLRAVASFD